MNNLPPIEMKHTIGRNDPGGGVYICAADQFNNERQSSIAQKQDFHKAFESS